MKNKVVADDDIVQEACNVDFGSHNASRIWKAINNQVFWRTNELCGHARRNAKSTQSIADIIGNSTPDVDDRRRLGTTSETCSIEAGYEDVERIDLIDIHAQISNHLVDVECVAKDAPTKRSQQPPESQKAPSNITGTYKRPRQSTRQHRHHDLRPIQPHQGKIAAIKQ